MLRMSNTEKIGRANLLGVGVHVVNMTRVVSLVEDVLADEGKHYICATGVHGIMEAQKQMRAWKAILNSSFLNQFLMESQRFG